MLVVRNRSSLPRGAPVFRLPTPEADFQTPPASRASATMPGTPAVTAASIACWVPWWPAAARAVPCDAWAGAVKAVAVIATAARATTQALGLFRLIMSPLLMSVGTWPISYSCRPSAEQ